MLGTGERSARGSPLKSQDMTGVGIPSTKHDRVMVDSTPKLPPAGPLIIEGALGVAVQYSQANKQTNKICYL